MNIVMTIFALLIPPTFMGWELGVTFDLGILLGVIVAKTTKK